MPRNILDIVITTVNRYNKIPDVISRKSGTDYKVIHTLRLHKLLTAVNALKSVKTHETGTRNCVVEGTTLARMVREDFSKEVTFQLGQNDEKSGSIMF